MISKFSNININIKLMKIEFCCPTCHVVKNLEGILQCSFEANICIYVVSIAYVVILQTGVVNSIKTHMTLMDILHQINRYK